MEYEVVVVGAGIIGSSTAYHLSRAGIKVLLLEQVVVEVVPTTCIVEGSLCVFVSPSSQCFMIGVALMEVLGLLVEPISSHTLST